MAVSFHFQSPTRLPARRKLKQFIQEMILEEGKVPGSLGIIFCSDEYLLEMNRQYLNHDYYTDIITFDLGKGTIEGELYISVDRVKDNAINMDVPYLDELQRVIFHGVLHLCGYKDKKQADILVMRKLEDEYLGKFRKV